MPTKGLVGFGSAVGMTVSFLLCGQCLLSDWWNCNPDAGGCPLSSTKKETSHLNVDVASVQATLWKVKVKLNTSLLDASNATEQDAPLRLQSEYTLCDHHSSDHYEICGRVVAVRVFVMASMVASSFSALCMMAGCCCRPKFCCRRDFLKDGSELAAICFACLIIAAAIGSSIVRLQVQPPDTRTALVNADGTGMICIVIALSIVVPSAVLASFGDCRSLVRKGRHANQRDLQVTGPIPTEESATSLPDV